MSHASAGAQASGRRRRNPRNPPGCLVAALLTLLICALLISFGALSISGHDPRLLWYQFQSVDTLRATREALADSYYGGPLPPFDKRVTDANTVQALYNAAFALPTYPVLEPMGCALGPNIVYHLAFSHDGLPVATIDLNLEGCTTVELAGVSSRWATEQFLEQAASVLRVSETDLLDPTTESPNKPPPPPQITLTVERIGETATARFTPLIRAITNVQIATALSEAEDADSVAFSIGGTPPPPASACPPNDGVVYRLTWSQNGAYMGTDDIEATGCQLIYTHDTFPPLRHISSPRFWQALASALGVSVASLGAGPVAPYWGASPTITPLSPPGGKVRDHHTLRGIAQNKQTGDL